MSFNTDEPAAVEMCMTREKFNAKHPLFIHKFIGHDNKLKCYKFRSTSARTKMRSVKNDFLVICSGCVATAYKSNADRRRHDHVIRSRRTDGFRMLSNPHSNHVPGCVPMDYEIVIQKTPPVTDVVKDKIMRGEDISMHMQPPGILFSIPNKYGSFGAAAASNIERNRSLNVFYGTNYIHRQPAIVESSQMSQPSTVSTNTAITNDVAVKTEEDLPLYIDLETNSIIGEPLQTRKRPSTQLGDGSCKKTALNPVARLPISNKASHDAQLPQDCSSRKVTVAPPMEFKKNIDAMMFNEDEAEVSVEDGKILRVVFERKTTSSDRSRSSFRLMHEFDLPDYVDRETIQTSWCDSILTVRAKTKSNASFV